MQRLPYTGTQAQRDNERFDHAVEAFLRRWITDGSGQSTTEENNSVEEFIAGGALREYFKRHHDPLELLLRDPIIAQHLGRNHLRVHFDPVTGQPMLAKFEARIYNLAAHREHLQIPYRYTPTKRQGAFGDSAERHEWSEEEAKKGPNIGDYFGTRRADDALVSLVHKQLRGTIYKGHGMPVILVTGAYLPNAVYQARHVAEAIAENRTISEPFAIVMEQRHGFSMQRQRTATEPLPREKENKHFGSAMLIFDPTLIDRDRIGQVKHAWKRWRNPNLPKRYAMPVRIFFADSLHYPGGQPDFRKDIEETFGKKMVERIELIGDEDLQQWDNNYKGPYEQDVNCSFYTQSILKGLIHIAAAAPEKLLTAPTDAIREHIRSISADYYDSGTRKAREDIRAVNLTKRWDVGRAMVLELARGHQRAARLNAGQKSWTQYVADRDELARDVPAK